MRTKILTLFSLFFSLTLISKTLIPIESGLNTECFLMGAALAVSTQVGLLLGIYVVPNLMLTWVNGFYDGTYQWMENIYRNMMGIMPYTSYKIINLSSTPFSWGIKYPVIDYQYPIEILMSKQFLGTYMFFYNSLIYLTWIYLSYRTFKKILPKEIML